MGLYSNLESLTSFIDGAPEGLALLDDSLVVRVMNRAFIAMTGVSARDAVGRPFGEAFPEWSAALGVAPRVVQESGQPLVDLEVSASARRWFVSCFSAPPGVGLSVREVHGAKRDEAPFLDREATFRAIFENATVGMLVVDWRGGGVRSNVAFRTMLGYSEEELARIGIQGLTHPDDYARDLEEFQRLMGGEIDHYQLEKRYLRSDGGVVWGRLFVSVARDETRAPILLIAMIEDITEQRRAADEIARALEEARRALGQRDEFLSIASHELNTPLTSLCVATHGLAAYGRDGAVIDAAGVRQIAMARRQGERLAWLVREMLDVTRLETGRFDLNVESFDLAELVREVVDDFASEFARTGTPVAVVAGAETVRGRWDRRRIEQVLGNLFSNALKYGAGKPVEVWLDADDGRVRVVVRDRGLGIAADKMPHIFEPFERGVSAEHFGGLGLGLYVVRRIVELHGGTVRAESEPGAGATFTVELPREGQAPAVGATP